jgi:hypothetical protein
MTGGRVGKIVLGAVDAVDRVAITRLMPVQRRAVQAPPDWLTWLIDLL